MTNRIDLFENKEDLPTKQEIVVANKNRLPIKAIGNIQLRVSVKGKVETIKVHDALYFPGISANLLSVGKIVEKGNKVIFDQENCKIFNKNGLIATATRKDNTYRLTQPKVITSNAVHNLKVSTNNTVKRDLWHRRLEHMNRRSMKIMRDQAAIGIEFDQISSESCITCLKGKQHRLPFQKSGKRAKQPLQLIHSDLCGPMENESIGGSRYFLTFIDDNTRKVFVYCLKSKTQVFDKFKGFKARVENESDHKIKKLHTDNGKEYITNEFQDYLRSNGIQHQLTVTYTPEQNGTAERMNRTLVEKAKCMLADAKLKKAF